MKKLYYKSLLLTAGVLFGFMSATFARIDDPALGFSYRWGMGSSFGETFTAGTEVSPHEFIADKGLNRSGSFDFWAQIHPNVGLYAEFGWSSFLFENSKLESSLESYGWNGTSVETLLPTNTKNSAYKINNLMIGPMGYWGYENFFVQGGIGIGFVMHRQAEYEAYIYDPSSDVDQLTFAPVETRAYVQRRPWGRIIGGNIRAGISSDDEGGWGVFVGANVSQIKTSPRVFTTIYNPINETVVEYSELNSLKMYAWQIQIGLQYAFELD